MHQYLVKYTIRDVQAMTIIYATEVLFEEEAAQLLIKQFKENNIHNTGLMIDEFKEIKNSIDWIRAELGRVGIFL